MAGVIPHTAGEPQCSRNALQAFFSAGVGQAIGTGEQITVCEGIARHEGFG